MTGIKSVTRLEEKGKDQRPVNASETSLNSQMSSRYAPSCALYKRPKPSQSSCLPSLPSWYPPEESPYGRGWGHSQKSHNQELIRCRNLTICVCEVIFLHYNSLLLSSHKETSAEEKQVVRWSVSSVTSNPPQIPASGYSSNPHVHVLPPFLNSC